MPRPRKHRKVCCLPESSLFGPINGPMLNLEMVKMTVEEYETIRLIDLEELTQEECSERMMVARTTIQKIYNDARRKIAKSLVLGNTLKIEGGDFKLYDEGEQKHGCSRCQRRGINQIDLEVKPR